MILVILTSDDSSLTVTCPIIFGFAPLWSAVFDCIFVKLYFLSVVGKQSDYFEYFCLIILVTFTLETCHSSAKLENNFERVYTLCMI